MILCSEESLEWNNAFLFATPAERAGMDTIKRIAPIPRRVFRMAGCSCFLLTQNPAEGCRKGCPDSALASPDATPRLDPCPPAPGTTRQGITVGLVTR